MPGPPPKPSSQRRRRNKPSGPDLRRLPTGSAAVEVPAASEDWHDTARRWYRSLEHSAQSEFYEPSDWAAAQFVAEHLSRVMRDAEDRDSIVRASSVQQIWSMMGDLLTTEAARRRARIEIVRADEGGGADIVAIPSYTELYGDGSG